VHTVDIEELEVEVEEHLAGVGHWSLHLAGAAGVRKTPRVAPTNRAAGPVTVNSNSDRGASRRHRAGEPAEEAPLMRYVFDVGDGSLGRFIEE